jgi:cytochrome c oxidase assembly protein subunit 11
MTAAGPPPQPRRKRRADTVVVVSCAVFVATMAGAAFAAVPLYDLFCRVTGFGGTPAIATAAPLEAVDREISVRFDANVGDGLAWRFRPVERRLRVRLGEVVEAHYEIESQADETTWGTAAFNVAPSLAGAHFSKISCFCFTAQDLAAGETRTVPVVFYVDPAIAEDDSTDGIREITLSYTFFPTPAPNAAPAAAPRAAAPEAERGDTALAVGGRIADTAENEPRTPPDG